MQIITTRSRLLRTTAIAFGLTALAGCQLFQNATPSTLASDVSLIAGGLQTVLATLQANGTIPGLNIQQITVWVNNIVSASNQIQTATAGVSTSTVSGIATTVADIAQYLLPLVPGGSAIVPVIEAAQALVPVILAAAGVAAASAAKPRYTPKQARALLAAGAA